MRVVDIGMPKLSDSMEEATVLAWLKQPGDTVRRGEPLLEVETDKATVVYEAEEGGVLEEILVEAGGSAGLGSPIARLRVGRDPASASRAPVPVAAPAPARAKATPVARQRAAELGVPLSGIVGSGPGGRIVAADVESATIGAGRPPAPIAAPQTGRGKVIRLPHTVTQRTIARRMSDSRTTIPEFTLEAEIPMDGAGELRESLRAEGCEPLPSFNDLVVKAAALALRAHPALNASYEDGGTLRFGRVNIGLAVALPDALVVPTILDADQRSLVEIASESRRLAAGARDRTLSPSEVGDGTFTVSNLGMFGVRRFHAVIYPPQAAILAVGEVAQRPVVEAGRLTTALLMDVALSCDHRVVYGAEAAQFLQHMRELLEHPQPLLVEGEGS